MEITSEIVEIHAPKEFHPGIVALLRKQDHLSSAKFDHNHATTHHIDCVPEARPFQSVPYRIGTKTRERAEFKIKRQLPARLIKHPNFE